MDFHYKADPNCENYQKDGTITQKFQTVFAVVPSASSNSTSNPVNVLWTLWPQGYDIASDNEWENFRNVNSSGGIYSYEETMKWYMASFSVLGNESHIPEEFPISISESKTDYYNASASDLANYTFYQDIGFFPFRACNGSGIEKGVVGIGNLPWMAEISKFDFQFDGSGANATYMAPEANSLSKYHLALYAFNTSFALQGTMQLSMTASIDPWHSDILVGGEDKPSWNLTVGYDKDYFGYPSCATANLYPYSSQVATLVVVLTWTTSSFMPF
ncbi:hypothetical protein N7478_005656 [Penicillium angulare]|uniref:uncharacterized protein n=1 Tax=Penicillium angulare TaxID=116970 RepID=UPI00253FC8D4|nr:uncharacterized protein N7478_005656 [Penicillium angulare]KAJ5280284.1 hypothetical protein N7478_005656 [Penicillium angulare]